MKITIAGGGITGLSAAHHILGLARERNTEVQLSLVESSGRTGGVISTVNTGDFIMEEGPDSFLTRNPSVIDLCEKLGITDQLIPTRKENRKVYIFYNGKLHPLPDGFYMMAPTDLVSLMRSSLFSLRGKLRMCLEPFIPARNHKTDESLYSFVTRRFGTEALERAVQPLMSGIYTADPRRLSLGATMPQFIEMERKYGSVIVGLRKEFSQKKTERSSGSGARYDLFMSFRNGMETLVKELEYRLPEGALCCNRRIVEARRTDRSWRLRFSDRSEDITDGLIMAVPSFIASSLLDNVDRELSEDLGKIEYLSSAVVNLVYRKSSLKNFRRSFGVLVPSAEKRDIIAFSFLSEKLENRAPKEYIIVRCFAGGELNTGICSLDDHAIINTCVNEIRHIFGAEDNPVYESLKRYDRSLPLYTIGHEDRVREIEKSVDKVPAFALAGSAYSGIGIPDCVSSGRKAAEKVFSDLF